MKGITRVAALLILIVATGPVLAQPDPTAAGLEERVITATLPRGAEIRGLLSRRPGAMPEHVALLFVGSPGILRLDNDDGQLRWRMKGNFLARARRHLNDDRVMTVMVDCPTDEWDGCDSLYRRSSLHAEDVAALMAAVTAVLGPVRFTVVGTSFGTVSSAHLVRLLGNRLRGAVHTSTFAGPNRYAWEAGMTGFDWSKSPTPQLFIQHRDDACPTTPYRDLASAIGDLPLITVIGTKDADGPDCEAYSAHGFRGREREVMRALAAWIVSGEVAAAVGGP
ncbi:alpha/beta hydrolase [Magnetospirillum sp. SS-4]|uniref:alpha/beta hydrolase n=1 Tax=Magnetospirillum sp. SS-4 TaxID=2681465 RepID=UPI0013804B75|nr:alpha/beta hydrolase [Magnetospirillum sp. SS-4]CAA7619387.1 conserved exported hypothetical protein [Magnetospirillum sp. SS-4]